MEEKLKKLDASLRTEADAYNQIQKGALFMLAGVTRMGQCRRSMCSIMCMPVTTHKWGVKHFRPSCSSFQRRAMCVHADINKNGEARRKFMQQLQENEMVLQVTARYALITHSEQRHHQLAILCTAASLQQGLPKVATITQSVWWHARDARAATVQDQTFIVCSTGV